MNRTYFVYIIASESGTLYIGMTNDLDRRLWEHRTGAYEGFSKKYGCKKLIYFETASEAVSAIAREKELKSWNRARKERLIRSVNPTWKELHPTV